MFIPVVIIKKISKKKIVWIICRRTSIAGNLMGMGTGLPYLINPHGTQKFYTWMTIYTMNASWLSEKFVVIFIKGQAFGFHQELPPWLNYCYQVEIRLDLNHFEYRNVILYKH